MRIKFWPQDPATNNGMSRHDGFEEEFPGLTDDAPCYLIERALDHLWVSNESHIVDVSWDLDGVMVYTVRFFQYGVEDLTGPYSEDKFVVVKK